MPSWFRSIGSPQTRFVRATDRVRSSLCVPPLQDLPFNIRLTPSTVRPSWSDVNYGGTVRGPQCPPRLHYSASHEVRRERSGAERASKCERSEAGKAGAGEAPIKY